ncbi:MAG: translocation/assembly module TamB domain-containing protein, partial [Thermoanaerobaculia bacterium]
MEDQQPTESDTLFPHDTGHHRSARERQRRGPMWGCLKALLFVSAGALLLLFIGVGGGWWYVGTSSFAGLVRLRVENTLEARLGRDVTIKSVEIVRTRPQKVILHDLRIANAPGSVSPHFATVREVIITGGVESFWQRRIKVGRVDIIDPRLNFEVYPEGAPLVHNFPKWSSGTPRKHEIVRLDIGQLFVTNGSFLFLDRRHTIRAESTGITSQVKVTLREGVYQGTMNSPLLRVKLQDYEPFDLDLRGGFRYAPGTLALNSIALHGRGIEAFVSGRLQPLTEGVYDLRLTSKVDLQRVREIFRVEKLLEGVASIDTKLQGRQGDFRLTGGWVSAGINADAYELTDAKGRLDVNGDRAIIDVESARYGGGTIGAHYTLSAYSEPYPMNVALRYNAISVEKLFSDWGIDDTGLRAAATGSLQYRWEKDRLLDGSGNGSARLARNAVAFSNAKYPIPIAGDTDFALNRGTITFRRAELDTAASHVSLTGTLGIENVVTDFRMNIRSSDFSELDRLAYNFARSAGKKDFDLLGLGGGGTISGTVRGPLDTPDVVAQISGTGTKYNNVVLGSSAIDLRYEGRKSLLTFERAVFSDGEGRLILIGTAAFPDRGPSPLFDIAVEAINYPVDRAIQAVALDLRIAGGRGTGKLLVSGTPDSGKVTFLGLTIARATAELKLAGDVNWRPGQGNVTFNLDIDARDFPVQDIVTFLDLGDLPVTGDVTGKLHISGPKDRLEGSGKVTVARGSIYGEPIDVASADILFTEGLLRARNLSITSPAGQITGEAEMNLATDKFSYTISSSSIDLSLLELLKPFRDLLGGRITISSSGAGTLEQPELVLEMTLHDATLRGLALPPGSAPPAFYLAIRNGRLIVRGSVADIVSIEGEGAVGENLTVDGNVKIIVTDIARLLTLTPQTTGLPASGRLVVDMKLGGRLSPIEALRIDATIPDLNLSISERQFTAPQPLLVGLRDGRIFFDSFELMHQGSAFNITGYAEITGDKRLAIDAQGGIEAALLQLFITDLRANGLVSVAASIRGTMAAPVVTGTAELQDAQVRFAGFPQLIDNINGILRFKGDSVEIESLRATVGGGTVIAGGTVTLDGLKPQRANVALEGKGVSLRYFEGVTVEGDFTLRISGDAERAVVQGDVEVNRALYFRDFDLQQAIVNALVSRSRITPIVAANWQQRVDLRIHLNAPNTLAVRNNVAEVTGSADLDLTGTLAEPVILGTVDLDEGGTVTFQSVDYRVVRGTINFQNPFRIDPYFDVTLEGRVSGGISEVEAGPIDLTVNLTGTLDRMQPSITSDPPASDITLFSLLGFGALTRNGTNDQSASVVGQSLLYSSLFSALGQRILPFADSFTYDPGLLDTGSGATPKVTFEKRVSNEVRLFVVYNLDDHKNREVIEWQATREWTLQITRDETAGEFRVEGRFRRRYRGHWTWGRRGRGEEIFDIGSVSEAIS